MSDVGNSHRMMKALGGPKRLELIDDSYHMIHIDRQKERVGALTLDFFDAVLRPNVPGAPANV